MSETFISYHPIPYRKEKILHVPILRQQFLDATYLANNFYNFNPQISVQQAPIEKIKVVLREILDSVHPRVNIISDR